MPSDLLRIGGIADVTAGLGERQSSIVEDLYNRKKHAEAVEKQKQNAAIETGAQKNRDLLASPDKLDNFVANNLGDIYPFAKRPKMTSEELRTSSIDRSIEDHPLAGSASAIKQKFSEALADPRYATVSHAQLLDAVKKDHLSAVGEDGSSLLDKANKFKFEKDNGAFRFFSDKGDENVIAMPGYEAYKAKRKAEKPYDTSLAEAVALNMGAAALMAGAGVLTGGAVPTATALALRLAGSAAIAYPEVKVMDGIANEAAKNRTTPEGTGSDLLSELALGAAGLLLTHKIVGKGTSAALSKAMQFEKTAATAAAVASFSGKAPEALEAYRTGMAAKDAARLASAATEAEKIAMRDAAAKAVKDSADELAAKAVGDGYKPGELLTNLKKNRVIPPESSYVMGLSKVEHDVAYSKPSILYNALDDEGVAAVHAAQEAGKPLDMAIIDTFNQQAALKKAAKIEELGGADKLSLEAKKAYGIKVRKGLLTTGAVGTLAISGVLAEGATEESEAGMLNSALTAGSKVFSPVTGVALGTAAVTSLASGNTEGFALGENTLEGVKSKSIVQSITDFITPSEANAGVASSVAGLVVSKTVGEVILEQVAKAGRSVESLIEEAIGKGYVGLPVAPGQVVMNPPMKQVVTAPAVGRGAKAYGEVVATGSTLMDSVAHWTSPQFFSKVYGRVEHRITNQMASMQSAIAHDTESGIKVISNILTPALKGEKAGNEIATMMKPIQDAYNEVVLPLRAVEIETKKAEGVIKNLKETLGSGSDDAAILERIAQEEAKIAGLTTEYATYSKQFPAVEEAYNAAKHELLTKYRTSRISYALEEPSLMKDPRYAALYSPEERAAVQQLTDVMEHYRGRSVEAGMDVITGPYNRHSMDKTKLNEAFAERLKTMGIMTDSRNISLSSFLERSKYSKQMIPDIQRNMLEYIPDAERRINVATLWDKKSENGWYAFSQNDLIKSNKVWNDYFDRLKKAYNPQENTLMNDLVNKYTSIETLRLLFLAPSAAFKHLFKNEGTWATLGFFNSMKHIPESAVVAARNSVNESFYRLGMDKNVGTRSQKDLFVRALTKQRHMLNPLDGMEKDPGIVSKFDEALQKVNNVGGIGIQMVEGFDRTHTVLSALDMAAKKGMTAEQAMSSIYSTILDNNFLGGGLNPEWMRNPKVRALMLFQGTPFKIMERRLANAMALGGDVKTAFGVIKNQNLEKNLQELQSIGHYMLDAQNEFKRNMIYDALTTHKDVYGNSVAAQFAREAIIVGSVIGVGKLADVDFHKHSLHIPFIKEGAAPELAVNPVTKAAWETTFGTVGQDDKTFFPARFLQKYFKTTGGSSDNILGGAQPLMLHKFRRLSNNDIPEIYKDSAFKYLFSVPSAH